jgi:hypothetical protein
MAIRHTMASVERMLFTDSDLLEGWSKQLSDRTKRSCLD